MQTPGTRTKNVNNRVQDKKINVVYLKKDFDEISFDIENLNNQNNKSDIKEQTTHDLDVTSILPHSD